MFFANNYFYLITIGLQLICVIHCVRKGKQNNWIWIIVFLPIVGCLAYIFTEMFSSGDINNVQSGVGNFLNPGGRIRKLENNLRFADTFTNRTMLADAYLASGNTDKAIELYESSLEGNFTENEYVLSQLIIAYFQKRRYEEIIPIAQKIYKLPQFARSKAHICYAAALGYTGHTEQAEKEFKSLKSKFSNYEARFQYGCFLLNNNRAAEAKQLFNEMINEAPHLSSMERRQSNAWIAKAREEVKKIT
ncbi:MAG: hypothetical protein QM764_19020 [Chitinophagaceae bacterium]